MNRIKIPETELEKYDEVMVAMPERPNTARLIVRPLKTIYINVAAEAGANIDRVFFDIEDFAEFMPDD